MDHRIATVLNLSAPESSCRYSETYQADHFNETNKSWRSYRGRAAPRIVRMGPYLVQLALPVAMEKVILLNRTAHATSYIQT